MRMAVVCLLLMQLLPLMAILAPAQDKKPPQPAVQRATGYVRPSPEKEAHYKALSKARHGNRMPMAAANMVLPAKFDVRDRIPLPMGNQANCGFCFGYSTIWFTFTSAGCQAGFGKPDGSFRLSCQWAMDRPRDFGGCNGGWGVEVADYICKNGMPAESWVDASGVVHKDYPPYEARSGNDRTAPGAKVWCKGWTWGYVNPDRAPSIDEIKAAMNLYGRLNVAIDAGGQFGNGTTTITQLGDGIDHEINVVAYDDNAVNPDGTKGAFLLENQWSTDWGQGGYRWVTYKAAAHITDWFWVSAGAQPPPPPNGIPVVSGGSAGAQVNVPWSYQIVATNAPTTYSAAPLPLGLAIDAGTGKIIGTPTATGTTTVTLYATNAAGTGTAQLTLTVGTTPPPPPTPPGVKSVVVTLADGSTQTLLPPPPPEVMEALMQWYRPAVVQGQPAKVKAAPCNDDKWQEQLKINKALLEAVEALQRQLLPKTPPPKKAAARQPSPEWAAWQAQWDAETRRLRQEYVAISGRK